VQIPRCFGRSRKGRAVHSLRVGGIAVADVVMTLVGAYIIAYYARASFAWTAAGLFLVGIILHRLFCVRTTIDKLLFPTAK
jgi:hypothetical protein